jgi:hypothetical protein
MYDNQKMEALVGAIVLNMNEVQRFRELSPILKRILGRSKLENRFAVFDQYLQNMEEEKRKDKSKHITFFIMANLIIDHNMQQVANRVMQYNYVSVLYGGLIKLLNGTQLSIQWSYNTFPNKYEFIKRFAGQFYHLKFSPVLIAARILQIADEDRFWKLLLHDKTELILLNMCSFQFGDIVNTERLYTLLSEDSSDIQRNVAMYLMTWRLNYDLEYFVNYSSDSKKKEVRDYKRRISGYCKEIIDILENISPFILTELLFNYLMTYSHTHGYLLNLLTLRPFAEMLMKPGTYKFFLGEIQNTDKIQSLEQIWQCLRIIRFRVDNAGINKGHLYKATTSKLISLIRSRKHLVLWNERDDQVFIELIKLMPKRNAQSLVKFLDAQINQLLISKIDQILRPEIYREDIVQYEILSNMLKYTLGVVDSVRAEKM